jgi:dTDP-4-amino-4,6-dideoxygalactose transaminase
VRLIEALRRAGYEVQGSYVPIHLLPYYERYASRRLSNAERLWSDLIELTCEPEVSSAHIERIAGVVKQALRSTVVAPSSIKVAEKASGRSASA